TIPAAVGLILLAYPIYHTLYHLTGGDVSAIELGGEILRWYAPTAILFAVFAMSSSILQGIERQRFAVFSLLVGLFLKLVLHEWFISIFHELGAILATDVGYLSAVVLNLLVIRYYGAFSFRFVAKRALLILIFAAAMGIVVMISTA